MDDQEQIAALKKRLSECQSELNGRRITGEMGTDRYCAVALLRNEVEQLRGRLAEAEAACVTMRTAIIAIRAHMQGRARWDSADFAMDKQLESALAKGETP